MNEKKTPVELLREQLKGIIERRERCHALRRQARYFARLPRQAEKLERKLEQAKAVEAEATAAIETAEDKGKAEAAANAAKAHVDTLERVLQGIKAKTATAEAKIKEIATVRSSLRATADKATTVVTSEFHRLVRMEQITKRNAGGIMPLVRQAGVPLGTIRKRRWAK